MRAVSNLKIAACTPLASPHGTAGIFPRGAFFCANDRFATNRWPPLRHTASMSDRREGTAPRVRDLPAPRKNPSVAGPLFRTVFAWPYRFALAALYRAGLRPWQLTLLSLIANAVVGILLLTVVGRGILRGTYGGRGRGRGGQIAVLGLVLVLLGYLGAFFGRLIQAAVSRQREFLADAAAVQFTRNPQGIAGALRRIGGFSRGSEVRDHHAQEVGHLIQCPRFVFQAQDESSFFGKLDFGRPQSRPCPLEVGNQQPELPGSGHFRSGEGFDVNACLTKNGSHLRHDAWTALTADDQLCGGWHETIPLWLLPVTPIISSV